MLLIKNKQGHTLRSVALFYCSDEINNLIIFSYFRDMPKKLHELTSVAITVETLKAVAKLAADRKLFDYEIIEEAVKEYLEKQ